MANLKIFADENKKHPINKENNFCNENDFCSKAFAKQKSSALSSRTYEQEVNKLLKQLTQQPEISSFKSNLLNSRNKNKHLIIIITSNRGLCGGFNTSTFRYTTQCIEKLRAEQKNISLLIIGQKGKNIFKKLYPELIIDYPNEIDKIDLFASEKISNHILELLKTKKFNVCSIIYNQFISALQQKITRKMLIPYDNISDEVSNPIPIYRYEPNNQDILIDLLKHNLTVQIYRALVENYASEQGARMTAMDGATRNANELINNLSTKYNRLRQSCITNELTEIISGAEAL